MDRLATSRHPQEECEWQRILAFRTTQLEGIGRMRGRSATTLLGDPQSSRQAHVLRAGALALIALIAYSAVATPARAYPHRGVTKMVSIGHDGKPSRTDRETLGIGPYPALSGNGRFVAFPSLATNLVEGDNNKGWDVFARDLRQSRTELISVSSQGVQPVYLDLGLVEGVRQNATNPSISASGRYVAFTSTAVNLVPGDSNVCPVGAGITIPCADVFMHDRSTGLTERISVSSDGDQGNAESWGPSISADGRYVAFSSEASNLVPQDTNGVSDVFIYDRKLSQTTRVSVDSQMAQGNDSSQCAELDASGHHIAFISAASNLVVDDTNKLDTPATSYGVDVFIRNLDTGDTRRASLTSQGEQSETGVGHVHSCETGSNLAISRGGRYVVFASTGADYIPNDTNRDLTAAADVFVRDMTTNRVERVSVTSAGEELDHSSGGPPSISDDGRYVSFTSMAKNLYPDDEETTNLSWQLGDYDAVVYDRAFGISHFVSINLDGEDGHCNTPSADPIKPEDLIGNSNYTHLSASGRSVAFTSCDKDLVAGDGRSGNLSTSVDGHQVYVRDLGPSQGSDLSLDLRGTDDFSKTGLAHTRDALADVVVPDRSIGADLIGGVLAYRPELSDLQIRLEIDEMPSVGLGQFASTGVSGLIYGARFDAAGNAYEVRAAIEATEPRFGLFDCTNRQVTGGCSWVADLLGGYGTTGERVVVSLPLETVGLQDGGVLSDVTVFSALGSYYAGSTEPLDSVRLSQ